MGSFDIRNGNVHDSEKEVEKALRPLSFGDFQGQKKIVENLEIFVQAAKMRGSLWTTSCCMDLPDWGRQRCRRSSPTSWAWE